MTYFSNPKGHIVFDCDGTLISSHEAVYEALAEVMTKVLGRSVSLEEIRQNFSPDLIAVAQSFGVDPLSDENLRESLVKNWEIAASKQKSPFRLFPGVKELLQKLLSEEYQLYVWTGRDRKSTLRILKELEVAQYFLEFRCMDDTAPKPLIDGLVEMVGEYDKSNIVVIGDSYTDIVGAKNFGCASIAACWAGEEIAEALGEFNPSSLAKAPQDCVKLIKNLIG